MKFYIYIFSIFVSALFVSCSEDDKAQSSVISKNTTVATIPESFPSGTILQINPKIILTSELTETTPASATYTNTQSGINFPVGNLEPITINLNKDGNDIILDFSVGSTEIILTFTEFTDLGADGFFDEFAVRVKINGTELSSAEGVNRYGFFEGSKKPRNATVTIPKAFTSAPNEVAFDELIQRTSMYLKFDGDKNESYLLDLFTSDKGILQHVGENHAHNIRFLYKNEDDASPKLQVSTEPGEDHQFELTLTFSNFYEGTFVRFTHVKSGNDVYGSFPNTGTFRFYNRIQLY